MAQGPETQPTSPPSLLQTIWVSPEQSGLGIQCLLPSSILERNSSSFCLEMFLLFLVRCKSSLSASSATSLLWIQLQSWQLQM